jgi:hypothetical protein
MSNYTKIVDFAAKDALITGNPAKLVKGTEIGAELDAISTAIATKYDSTDLGVTVQAYDADLATWAGVTPGTGVATALAINVGTAGAPVINGGALGTPASGTLTNATGLPAAGVTGTALVAAAIGTTVQAYDADLTTWAGVTPGTGVATALAVNVGTAGAPVVNGGALGTPSSGTLTNATGLPAAGVTGTAVVGTTLQGQTYTAFTTAGSSTTYTLTPTPASTANATGQRFRVTFNAASGATPTLAVSGQTAKNLKYYDSAGAKQAITSTQVPINWISDVEYDGTDWVVLNVPPVATVAFDPASPGAIGGTTPGAITATTLKHTGAMDSQAVRYAGDASYHREAEITKTFNPGPSAAIDVATCTLTDNYSVAIVTVEAMGMSITGNELICIAKRTVKMAGDSPTFTTVGTDLLSNGSVAFSYVATHGFKATITNGIAQQCYGGMKMSVIGGGGDYVDGGITSLT